MAPPPPTKFQTKQDCENSTGDTCQADNGTSDGGTTQNSNGGVFLWYRPWMYGYMMNQTPAAGSSDSYYRRSAPVYQGSADGELVTSHGDDLNTKTTKTSTSLARSALSSASKPMSTSEAESESETGAFGRSSRAVTTTVSEGEGEEGVHGSVARGGFGGGEGEAGGAHGGGVGE